MCSDIANAVGRREYSALLNFQRIPVTRSKGFGIASLHLCPAPTIQYFMISSPRRRRFSSR
ncbi:hypothetical protein CYA_1643 [Synechococcus sp. JA-3-3Ab]|nr:hypothetical protein CYA_1643 [Synechococcus sp. JA-3-3Ab]